MNFSKIPTKFISVAVIALCFGLALYIRVYFPYDNIFREGLIKFSGNDAYYFMRLVDNLVHNFPHPISFDPYMTYPGGPGEGQIGTPPFFPWLLAGIIWLIGLGSPSEHTVGVVGVYFPAVLVALSVIPVYFIGKELFGRWVGLISAGLLAILPGEFLGRSILGFTDYHVTEILFTTTMMMFLVLAIKTSRERGLTIDHLRQRDWAITTKPAIYSLLAGIFLGIYLITWIGALLFIFIISIYLVVQSVIEHLRRESTDYLCLVGITIFLAALAIYGPVWHKPLHMWSLVIALFIPVVLTVVSRGMTKIKIRPAYYPLTLVGLGGVGLAIFYAIAPSFLKNMLSTFTIFTPKGVELTTLEMQPLLFPAGNFTLMLAWGNFTTDFFISLISLGILIYLVIKRGSAGKSLLLVWSLVILATALGQRRFAYYFAVNVALLTGYLSWLLLQLAGFKKAGASPIETPPKTAWEKAQPRKKYQAGFNPTIRHINMALAVIVVFFLVFFPNIKPAVTVARQAQFAPSDAWCGSLTWLKENTPEPFGNPNFYYELYEPPLPGEQYEYPESAYGVMSWWDYGYLITRIAHRLPYSSPGSSPASRADTARFFLSTDEGSAQQIIEELDSAYVIIDYSTATTKFWAIAEWAGMHKTQFYDFYFQPQENRLVGGVLYYPEYYRSLVVRLYNFDGQAVTPEAIKVVSYEERMHPEVGPIKLITNIQEFPSYEEATAYVSSQKSGNHRIAGNNPFVSPVPLTASKHYKLIHSSEITAPAGPGVKIPEVKTFEYVGD